MKNNILEKKYECAIELMQIDVTKTGYVKAYDNLYNKYGVDVVNAVRDDFGN